MTEPLDAVTLQVLSGALRATCEEMGAVLVRSAHSANIKERRDASTALFDRDGQMVMQAEHIPVHLGAMPESVAAVKDREQEPGDAWILNDPYQGDKFLPDITLISPLFVERRHVGFAANRAHHADVGGSTPGSMPADSTTLSDEGVVIPAVPPGSRRRAGPASTRLAHRADAPAPAAGGRICSHSWLQTGSPACGWRRRGRDRVQLFGDLTVEDLVAEEPEPIRLARALTLSSTARSGLPQIDAERVSDLAVAIAEHLGADAAVASRCRLGGLLHDIGTVAVGDRILGLVGPPVARDRMEYESHPGAGARLVRGVAGVSDAAGVVAAHEEWYDGTGYPAALSGNEIPLEARIVACAIAFVKLAQALGGTHAVPALERQAGSALDPDIVAALLALLARERGHAARHLRDVPAA